MVNFSHQWLSSIKDLEQSQWQRLFGDDPFTSYAFLYALEESQCVNKQSGWQPQHLAIYANNTLVALAPGYLKSHSYGEYVFDWAWAEAYEKNGLNYYPKWLCGIPFSPIAGKRIAIKHNNPNAVYAYLSQQLNLQCVAQDWSGWHINFCEHTQASQLVEQNTMLRMGVQFQWFNKGYETFEDFLQTLNSRKRKLLKKERAKITHQNITVQWLQNEQLSPAIMQLFCQFYQRTYLKRSGHLGYLNTQFFTLLHTLMPDKLVVMFAKKEGSVIAATLSLIGEDTLYGRYWGASEDIDSLHFELCYYQGIEYAIKNKLKRFHSGAQGEHKIARGFEPVFTYSTHHIVNHHFSDAIKDYLERERKHIHSYKEQCHLLLPFKNE